MGFFDRFRAKPQGVVREGEQLVLRTAELAARLRPPDHPNFSGDDPGPCATCGKPLEELFITTGGPLGDPDLWRDHPVAVDGWACVGCGVFRYPRTIEPTQITVLANQGVEHGRAGRFAEAEQCFARIVWDWPGYLPGHLNYAEAMRSRLQRARPDDEAIARAVEERMVAQFAAAIDAFLAKHEPAHAATAIAQACLTCAEVAIEHADPIRAHAFLAKLAQLADLPADVRARADEIEAYLDARHDLFEAAARTFGPRIRLQERAPRPPATAAEREECERALAGLADHLALAPQRWQAHWLYAKALTVVGRDADALAAWAAAVARFPAQRELVQDYSIELMLAERSADARRVVRAYCAQQPDDAQSLSNLAVLEILCGDLAAAEQVIARAAQHAPNDPILSALRTKVARCRATSVTPRTLAELEEL